MKRHFLITALAVIAVSFAGKAQQEAPLGRFIIGTAPLNFAYSMQNNVTQSSYYNSNTGQYYIQSDTAKPTTFSVAAHINLFVGYFLTKNICTGLQFSPTNGNAYSTFIRYYFGHKNHDSAKVDLFVQVNGTYAYFNTDNPATVQNAPENYEVTTTTEYTTSNTTVGFNLGFAVAYHLTRHWALETELGYAYSNQVGNTGSYTSSSIYTPPNSSSYGSTSLLPALKSVTASNKAILTFMLSYRI